MSDVVVLKFGGSSLSTAELREIAASRVIDDVTTSPPARRTFTIVVTAPGDTSMIEPESWLRALILGQHIVWRNHQACDQHRCCESVYHA